MKQAIGALLFCYSLSGWAQTEDTPSFDQNNVVIVLDASGSMDDPMRGTSMRKIDAAKKALRQVLQTVPQDTNIGVLVFSAKNLSQDWIYPLGPRDDEALLKAIDLPQPGGRTPLGKYTKKGADALLAKRKEQYGYGSYRLLVVTDGEAHDSDLVDSYVPDVMSRGITIDVIGVDMASAHTMATKVHSYRRANDPRSLEKAVAEVFAEIADSGTNAVAQDAFDQLADISEEMAASMLKSLTISGNHPIGEMPKVEVAVEDSAQPSADSTAATPSPPPDTTDDSGWGFTEYLFLAIAIYVIFFFRPFRKKKK
jgi:hypothetical protein